MKQVFDRFSTEEDGNAVIDWTVLMAGMVLLAVSIVMTVTRNSDEITDATMDHVSSMEDQLPS